MDLTIRPGPGVPRGIVVPAGDLVERFARSSGPGGQGVNTTDSRVQLSLDLAGCAAFTPAQRARLLRGLAGRVVGSVLTVDATEERSQLRNRRVARERMGELVRSALAPPPPTRRATRPTRGSQERRLAAKRRRAATKEGRGRVTGD